MDRRLAAAAAAIALLTTTGVRAGADLDKRWLDAGGDDRQMMALDLTTAGPEVGYTMVYANPEKQGAISFHTMRGRLHFDCAGRQHRAYSTPGVLRSSGNVVELLAGGSQSVQMPDSPAPIDLEQGVCRDRDPAQVRAASKTLGALTSEFLYKLREKGAAFTPRPLGTEFCSHVSYDAKTMYLVAGEPRLLGPGNPQAEFSAFLKGQFPGQFREVPHGCRPGDASVRAEWIKYVEGYSRERGTRLVLMDWKPGMLARPVKSSYD